MTGRRLRPQPQPIPPLPSQEQQRLASALAEIEWCRRNHTGQGRRIVELEAQLEAAGARLRLQKVETAKWRERAETLARMEEDSWAIAVARGDQLRAHHLVPANEGSVT